MMPGADVYRLRWLLRPQAVAQGVRCRLGTVRGTSLGEDIADVCGYGIEADVQRIGNITISVA
jgi:hypothetical protein